MRSKMLEVRNEAKRVIKQGILMKQVGPESIVCLRRSLTYPHAHVRRC